MNRSDPARISELNLELLLTQLFIPAALPGRRVDNCTERVRSIQRDRKANVEKNSLDSTPSRVASKNRPRMKKAAPQTVRGLA